MIGHFTYFKIYNVSSFEIKNFEDLQTLAMKLRLINQHYDPATVDEPIVAIEDSQTPLFIDAPPIPVSELDGNDKDLLKNVKCGVYAEGIDDEGEPYFAYFHIKADLLQEFLQKQSKKVQNLKDFFCYPAAHGQGVPTDDIKLAMARKCFIRGVLQIFGFREKAIQW